MSMEKQRMAEAATLYYERKCTQQEIAQMMGLSRQTVSKLLNDAVTEGVVEIRIHNPQNDCDQLRDQILREYALRDAVICSVSGTDPVIQQLMTVKKAVEYLLPMIQQGKKNIALSWGRTLQALIVEFPHIYAGQNTVFPLFGATDSEKSCFLSNELARSFADKIGAEVQYAWFPYRPDRAADCELLRKTSYYRKLHSLWQNIDLAIVGIGNTSVLQLFESAFGYRGRSADAVGDVATHFFKLDGTVIEPYSHTLCASAEDLRHAGQTVAIACSHDGDDKIEAIVGALRTGLIDVLITDQHTARDLISRSPYLLGNEAEETI